MKKTEATNKALLIKMRIVDVLNRAMLRNQLDYKQLASTLKVSQTRVKALLCTTEATLDLIDLLRTASFLNVGIRVRSGSDTIYSQPRKS